MRTVDGRTLHDGDFVKLSRHSQNVYQYKEGHQYLKKILAKQTVRVETIRYSHVLAVVKV